jgi:hypothetical protein
VNCGLIIRAVSIARTMKEYRLELKAGLHAERMMTNRLIYGTTRLFGCLFSWFVVVVVVVVSLALQPSAGYGLLVTRSFLITHNDAPQSVGLLWTSDQLVAETST